MSKEIVVATMIFASAVNAKFVQKHLFISGYLDPPTTDVGYAAASAANFSGWMGDRSSKGRTGAQDMVELCTKHRLSCLPDVAGLDSVNNNSAILGYYIRDEPHAQEFEGLSKTVAEVRKKNPDALSFINLLGMTAGPSWWGTPTYSDYVNGFVKNVQPDILCFDIYPSFPGAHCTSDPPKNGSVTPEVYTQNLAIIRNSSLANGMDFWLYFNFMGRPACGPTVGQVAWQQFSALAYGATGLLYFYVTPCKAPGDCSPKTELKHLPFNAILRKDGSPNPPLYQRARYLNAKLAALGPTLMTLRSIAVMAIDDKHAPWEQLGPAATIIQNITTSPVPDYLLGVFAPRISQGGRLQAVTGRATAVLFVNNDPNSYSVVTMVLAPGTQEVDQNSGELRPPVDDEPQVAGFQQLLLAGEGRLYVRKSMSNNV